MRRPGFQSSDKPEERGVVFATPFGPRLCACVWSRCTCMYVRVRGERQYREPCVYAACACRLLSSDHVICNYIHVWGRGWISAYSYTHTRGTAPPRTRPTPHHRPHPVPGVLYPEFPPRFWRVRARRVISVRRGGEGGVRPEYSHYTPYADEMPVRSRVFLSRFLARE